MSGVVDELVARLSLERPHQTHAVRRAMTALIDENRRGVVLADEVGCGKTYEALGIAALLWAHHQHTDRPIRRILVLADGALMTKWFNEIELRADAGAKGPKRGFTQYVSGASWDGFRGLLANVVKLESRHDGNEAGVVEARKRQVRPDRIYLTKQSLLSRNGSTDASRYLRDLRNTDWDLIIVDEAHNYTGLHTQRSKIFFEDGTPESRIDGLTGRYVLALTATPFQLVTRELLNLLRVVHAEEADLEALDDGLRRYEKGLESFYARRHLPPTDAGRCRAVEALRRLRLDDASGGSTKGAVGLEPLLRRYVIRNVKSPGTREYRMSEDREGVVHGRSFQKLDDVRSLVKSSALLPLKGADAWVYMQVRDLIDDARAAANSDVTRTPTFVAGDLRQCLSSYEQLGASSLLMTKGLPRAEQVKQTLTTLSAAGHRHPKVRALCEVIDSLVTIELDRVRPNFHEMPGKILVFNTLMKTASALAAAVNETVRARLDPFILENLALVGWNSFEEAKAAVDLALDAELEAIRERLVKDRGSKYLEVDRDLLDGTGVAIRGERANLVDIMFHRAKLHCHQPLFLLRLARYLKTLDGPPMTEDVAGFLMNRVTERLWSSLDRIVDDFLDDSQVAESHEGENRERATREIARLAQILAAPQGYVGRFDGETAEEDRERNRENFNRPYAPLVLLVSRVGEEGIDLQAHTRYVLHYDIEWNPAKMEQREGRVDREGRHSKEPVRVQFFLLKDTYEERVFHTVMQRHLWFEVLIGSKKKELAKGIDVEPEPSAGVDLGIDETGQLTDDERAQVMLDLSPGG